MFFPASVEALYSADAESLCNSFKSFVHNFDVFTSYALATGTVDSTSFIFVLLDYVENHDFYLNERKNELGSYGIALSTSNVLRTLYDYNVIKYELDQDLDVELANLLREANYLKKCIEDDWSKQTNPKKDEDLPF
nr:MAG TPA: hypothetical protein [Caudoviricetes sp.]